MVQHILAEKHVQHKEKEWAHQWKQQQKIDDITSSFKHTILDLQENAKQHLLK